ncbi:hypothetical protein SteCoe_8910 [Stentor coeruleus]|uniref:Uncharacterized protein n=1 Tax=Stentor coeruleus TaxID=5963 RepID=A0A1R2CJ64_9CILI|nr:hypothetical protein SteCoe_8910 [Stentor coeruleus]
MSENLLKILRMFINEFPVDDIETEDRHQSIISHRASDFFIVPEVNFPTKSDTLSVSSSSSESDIDDQPSPSLPLSNDIKSKIEQIKITSKNSDHFTGVGRSRNQTRTIKENEIKYQILLNDIKANVDIKGDDNSKNPNLKTEEEKVVSFSPPENSPIKTQDNSSPILENSETTESNLITEQSDFKEKKHKPSSNNDMSLQKTAVSETSSFIIDHKSRKTEEKSKEHYSVMPNISNKPENLQENDKPQCCCSNCIIF